jgi:hypothetical protein
MITLPEGHNWKNVAIDGTHEDFHCSCGATFSVDLTDNSTEYDEGDGHDEE